MPQNACLSTQVISQRTLLASLDEEDPARVLLVKIPLETWSVLSFNPLKNDACVLIDNGKRTVILNLFIPSVIVK